MKKLLLTAVTVGALGTAQQAQAQFGSLLVGGVLLGKHLADRAKMTPEQKAAELAAQQAAEAKAAAAQQAAELNAAGPAVPAELHLQRTAADKLPKKGGEQITALEAELERCHAATLASATSPVCTPEQRAVIQRAAVAVARAQPNWDLHPYQQEMAFYGGEDSRRQAAGAVPAAPTSAK